MFAFFFIKVCLQNSNFNFYIFYFVQIVCDADRATAVPELISN